ncbi:MAG: PD-(D/E)XK nuclease family protein [Patescibacteria group bacterium]
MSQYYNPKRAKNIFDPQDEGVFKLSRTKIDLFIECPRCFYLDRRLGVGRPPGFPFSLNSAVDKLLKKEFDVHRTRNIVHPLMKSYGIDAIPFSHEKMNEWRDNFKGIQYHHKPTNFVISGAIDDIWVDPKGKLMIVDYKSTSKNEEVNIDAEWQMGYKRQMEIYQWLFRRNGFDVSNTGYFVYCNGNTDKETFDAKLEFDVKIIPYKGNDNWVEDAIIEAHKCLMLSKIPYANKDCDYCRYIESVKEAVN